MHLLSKIEATMVDTSVSSSPTISTPQLARRMDIGTSLPLSGSTGSAGSGDDFGNEEQGILTPGRKIRAMLAQFDSDSDSENDKNNTKSTASNRALALPLAPPTVNLFRNDTLNSGNDDPTDLYGASDNNLDEDDIIAAPAGRMAARMTQGQKSTEGSIHNRAIKSYTASNDDNHRDASARTAQHTHSEPSNESSEDDILVSGPRRRPTKKKILNYDENRQRERSISPLVASQSDRNDDSDDNIEEVQNEINGSTGHGDIPRSKEVTNARFIALVEQKRKEREEKEAIEAEKKRARWEQLKQFSSEMLSGEESDDDPTSARNLTQQSKPARKASKKALEEMKRETQRMSRNMQLAHQAKTKTKISKESFLARFNFGQQQEPPVRQRDFSPNTSPVPSSDVEGQQDKDTPPTSPAGTDNNESDKSGTINEHVAEKPPNEKDNLLNLSQQKGLEVVEEISISESNPIQKPASPNTKSTRKPPTKPSIRVRISRQAVARGQQNDSDSDLEVITSPGKCRRIAAFENFSTKQTQESASMIKIKALAHLTSPSCRRAKMKTAEFFANLQLQARQQAAKERETRIEELRAQGIYIETAEERAAMEVDVENLMDLARKEADEIAKREKAARGKSKGAVDSDDSDDEDYGYSGSDRDHENDGDESEEGSGEEEEEDDKEDQSDLENRQFIDQEASEAEESDDDRTEASSSDGESNTVLIATSRKRRMRIVEDDEEDEAERAYEPANSIPSLQTPQRPQIPRFSDSEGFSMGLTQAFAGTLGDSQENDGADSLEVLRGLPVPDLPGLEMVGIQSQVYVRDSQESRHESLNLFAGYTQSETRVSESPGPHAWSPMSQIPDPTQDAGFVLSPFDQNKRFIEPPASTVETILLPEKSSPAVQKRARLLHRRRPQILQEGGENVEMQASAFDIIRTASKKVVSSFDKSKSKAKEHVDEAAEESDDEYAGLGGASDDNDGGEDEYDRQMINDEDGEEVDEKELAALNANHHRQQDEKDVAKLMKDITTGALRRRRGVSDDMDLDDSDDERLARRQAKQREFARMRKALMADENIGKIAENPKKAAFFKTIEDHDSGDELDMEFLDPEMASGEEVSSQDVRQNPISTDTNDPETKKRKRPLESSADDVANRPPPSMRRTAATAMSKKPVSLAEIRATVSFLTETPEYDSFREDVSIDEEDLDVVDSSRSQSHEESDFNGQPSVCKSGFAIPPNPRRSRGKVVDRLALLRAASSNSATSHSKAAFLSNSGKDDLPSIGFRPPILLRRTTTSSSVGSTSSSSSGSSRSRTTIGPPPGASLAKKGSVNYYTAARERERERELRTKERGTGSNIASFLCKQKASMSGGLGQLMGQDQWE